MAGAGFLFAATACLDIDPYHESGRESTEDSKVLDSWRMSGRGGVSYLPGWSHILCLWSKLDDVLGPESLPGHLQMG